MIIYVLYIYIYIYNSNVIYVHFALLNIISLSFCLVINCIVIQISICVIDLFLHARECEHTVAGWPVKVIVQSDLSDVECYEINCFCRPVLNVLSPQIKFTET